MRWDSCRRLLVLDNPEPHRVSTQMLDKDIMSSFTVEELRSMLNGNPDVDVDMMQPTTQYSGGLKAEDDVRGPFLCASPATSAHACLAWCHRSRCGSGTRSAHVPVKTGR